MGNKGCWESFKGRWMIDYCNQHCEDPTQTHTTIYLLHIYTHTHTHTDTHVCYCELWGLSIGVMVVILYKLYFLSLYTNPTPKPTPYRKLSADLLSQKTHSVWFISIWKMGTWGNVLINHLLFVIPVIPVSLYTFMSSYVTNTHTNTHTHTHTHTHAHTHRHTHTHTRL